MSKQSFNVIIVIIVMNYNPNSRKFRDCSLIYAFSLYVKGQAEISVCNFYKKEILSLSLKTAFCDFRPMVVNKVIPEIQI